MKKTDILFLADACAADILGDSSVYVDNVVIDSRAAREGSLFVCVIGEVNDGHNYVEKAYENGCRAFLMSRETVADMFSEAHPDACVALADDTQKAFKQMASAYLSQFPVKRIGVTGSVGKTTTKDFIASVLGASFNTFKTQGNHNNEIGLPMTLLGLPKECEAAVLEMGMSSRGEIDYMTRLAKPKVAVITNIGTSHMASLGSRENIALAKLEIANGMDEDGVLIINGDEPLLTEYKGEVRPEIKSVGIYNKCADFKAVNIRSGEAGMTFDILYGGTAAVNVEIPMLGRHNVYNALFAWAVGTVFGMSEQDIRKGLLAFEGSDMRQKIYELGNITVIEDCYNAAPESMRAAIEVLVNKASCSGGAPCALLGDMLELGDDSRLMHDQLGQYAAQMGIQK
ncbi:MAG: UDP-N-acetylmuramoyl-tripeptide--D-alanyl-D-alanine ligase, partial [Firmicutes bacterium]|nr:UDP-N-acetylmuramoyl-tripeptide--D-alanyl-D-alanine ligase [Bacillota bacterium]